MIRNQDSSHKRTIIPQAGVGDGALNRLLKVGHKQIKEKLRKGSVSICLTLAIGCSKYSVIGSQHRFSPLLHSTEANLLEVLEKINHSGMPFVGIAFIIIIIIIRSNINCGSGIENHVCGTPPTMELFMDTMELEEALQEGIHVAFNDVVNQFDIIRALGLDVVDADLWCA